MHKYVSIICINTLELTILVLSPISQDGRVNALYSTPSIYTDAKFAANESWPLKTNDFFPYVLSYVHNLDQSQLL